MGLISIIVPIYNAEEFLSRCLDSIISQSYTELDILLINDGSTDKSSIICEEYAKKDKRIRILNKENSGVSVARNIGINNAKGEWICFIDADDYIEVDFISGMVDIASKSDAEVILGGVVEVRNEKKTVVKHYCSYCEFSTDRLKELACFIMDNKPDIKNWVNTQLLGYACARIYKKNIINNIRFAENITMREDALFNIDVLLRAKKLVITDMTMYKYIIHSNSATGKFHANYGDEVILYLKYCRNLWNENKLPFISYHIGTLYAYMAWLKLYAMHPQSGFSFKQCMQKIRESCNLKIWKESFEYVSYGDLTKPYRVLKCFFNKKCYVGIYILYLISRILQRK